MSREEVGMGTLAPGLEHMDNRTKLIGDYCWYWITGGSKEKNVEGVGGISAVGRTESRVVKRQKQEAGRSGSGEYLYFWTPRTRGSAPTKQGAEQNSRPWMTLARFPSKESYPGGLGLGQRAGGRQ